MAREIVVNVGPEETRVALREDGQLTEFFLERQVNQRIVGNIYKGRVENVLPGMGAAFVNIGLEKNAFLYVEDAAIKEEEKNLAIDRIVKTNQEVITQIVKEPMGSKGARITNHITLPGRYLVLMPTVNYIGISRRIAEEEARERLKKIAERIKPENMGIIIRTVAENEQVEEELTKDLQFLLNLWQQIQEKNKYSHSPAVLYHDLDLVYRTIRDLFTEDVDRFILDSQEKYQEVAEFLDSFSPTLRKRLYLYQGGEDIFKAYGIENEMQKALRRKIWLKSGGYLIFDQTEALTVIDVNTGKYVGSNSFAETILKTNLEAAKEIIRQIRLRSLGGIILIDFIDMEIPEHRENILAFLEEEVKKDRTKTAILGITQLGLVEMTRKKVRPSLESLMQKTCPCCEGRGRVLSEEALVIKAQREIEKAALNLTAEALLVGLHPTVAGYLIGPSGSYLRRLEERSGKYIYIKGIRSAELEEVKIITWGSKKEVEARSLPVRVGEQFNVEIEEPHLAYHQNGLVRLSGYVVEVEKAGSLIGEKVTIEITQVNRTYAKAKVVGLV